METGSAREKSTRRKPKKRQSETPSVSISTTPNSACIPNSEPSSPLEEDFSSTSTIVPALLCPNQECAVAFPALATGIHNCPGCNCSFSVRKNKKDGLVAARLPSSSDGKVRVHCVHCGHRGKLAPVAGRYLLTCTRCGGAIAARIQLDQSVLVDPKHVCPGCDSTLRLLFDKDGNLQAYCDSPNCDQELEVFAPASLREALRIRLKQTARTKVNVRSTDPNTPQPRRPTPAQPRILGDFELLEQIGAGGMGEIHRAKHTSTGEIVAIKIIRRSRFEGQNRDIGEQRFLREIQLLRQLSQYRHENLACYIADGREGEELWYAMEFVEGKPLSLVLKKSQTLPWEQAAWICGRVADALNYAHNQNVLHRDIKDANIILCPNGSVRLIDFGLAKAPSNISITETTDLPGTLGFLAPELFQPGGEYTVSSDLFALGVVFLKMVFGASAIKPGEHAQLPAKAAEIGLPKDLIDLFNSMLSPRPEDRPKNANEARNKLNGIVNRCMASTRPDLEAEFMI